MGLGKTGLGKTGLGAGLGARLGAGLEAEMLDALFVLITIVFFAIATAYVAGCERLGGRR